ncbi:hypothetical protein ACFCXA_25815 [Streptomyces virginiae]|uniref:hypothetical protein n=1 Tax=Streptomyces virginiae TaxID=1961 RepID=UPI0035DDDB3E
MSTFLPTLTERRSPWVTFTRADDPWVARAEADLLAPLVTLTDVDRPGGDPVWPPVDGPRAPVARTGA